MMSNTFTLPIEGYLFVDITYDGPDSQEFCNDADELLAIELMNRNAIGVFEPTYNRMYSLLSGTVLRSQIMYVTYKTFENGIKQYDALSTNI